MINLYILIWKLIINVWVDVNRRYSFCLLSIHPPSDLRIKSASSPYLLRIKSVFYLTI